MVETTTSLVKLEQDGGLFLPPGFRFHPTDAEVILSYLLQKFLNPNFTSLPIGEVDLNKCEPWDLPSKAKMGEKEWYFFCHKDMKYPTGMRTNRATKEGYWKATGKDREIFKQPAVVNTSSYGGSSNNKNNKQLVGMKKTLVFYMGRAPKGTKTNWVMHEFRLHANLHNDNPNLRLNPKDEWVVCKVFHKGDEAINKQQQAQAAAVDQYSAGTPNNGSSVEAGDDDDFFQLDSIIDPSIYFSNSSANILSAPPNMSNNNAEPYNSSVAANGASTTTTSTTSAGSFQQLPNYYSLINKSSSSNVSSWNNMPPPVAGGVHRIGSSYSLQHQAAMVKALGDVIRVPNPLGVPQYKLDGPYLWDSS